MQRHKERKQTKNSGLQRHFFFFFLKCRKTKLKCLAKTNNSNKNHMGAAALRPTWCLQSTLSTLQAWKKVQRFCEPDNCLLLLFGSHASNVRQPSGPVPGAAVVRVHRRPVRCSQDPCDWRQTGEPSLLPAINIKKDGSI